ncbi:hypothetical protein [Hydrogenophaga sp. H7]|uniref:hypothetical protein n=1 Tax=Hydrogenophaga sp. H7 TaxID=1882399 RepID=UPI00117B96F1|nr:hypothetical protein [Hydrogenophaga sp. H7]
MNKLKTSEINYVVIDGCPGARVFPACPAKIMASQGALQRRPSAGRVRLESPGVDDAPAGPGGHNGAHQSPNVIW